jgi:hypothetical protein
MKNSMQDVVIKLQKDSNNVVSLFKQNVNGVAIDKVTGARTPQGNTMFVFKTDIDDSPLNFVTGKQYTAKTRQAIHRLEYLDATKASKWIKKRLKDETIQELNALGLSDLFTNPESLAKASALGLELLVDIHIVKQEFGVNLTRFKSGKHAQTLLSYKQCLARYADSDIFTARFINHLLQGVMNVDAKLVSDKGSLRDINTGKFNFNLVETLDEEIQAKIAQAIDDVMFGKKTDKAIINGKLKRLPNFGAHLLSKQGEFILSYDFPVDTDDALTNYPDITIEIDTEVQSFKAHQTAERQARSASNFDMLANESNESSSKEEEPKAKKAKKQEAEFPSSEEV